MKILLFSVVVLVFASSQSQSVTIIRPGDILSTLEKVKAAIFGYSTYVEGETSLGYFLPLFRQINQIILLDNFNYTLASVFQSVEQLYNTGAAVQTTLAAEKQTACMVNLGALVSQTIEQSGYAVSDCVTLTNTDVLATTQTYFDDISASEAEVNDFPVFLINAFIGRNVFIQPDHDDLIQRLGSYSATLEAFQTSFDRILAESNDFALGWSNQTFTIAACLSDIQTSMQSTFTLVQSQIPTCRKFG